MFLSVNHEMLDALHILLGTVQAEVPLKALQTAASNGKLQILRIILSISSEEQIEAAFTQGDAILQEPIANGSEMVVTLYLRLGTPVTSNLLHTAAVNGRINIIEMLLQAKNSASVREALKAPFIAGAALQSGNHQALLRLLQAGTEIQASDIVESVRESSESVVRILQRGCVTFPKDAMQAAIE